MGLFDRFKKQDSAAQVHDHAEDYDRTPSQNITVNLTETAIELNGKSYTFPIPLTDLVELFGEPEKFVFGKMYIDVLSDKQNALLNQTTPDRLNYVWHELGIKAYCYDRVSVRAFQFLLRPYSYREMPPASPSNMFGGKLTINGKPWFGVMNSAEDREVFRRLELDCYSIIAEYTDPFDEPDSRTEKSYTTIEINLKQ